MTVYRTDPLRDSRWAQFVEEHPSASAFHTPGWLEALRRTYEYVPVVFTTCPPDSLLTNGIVFCDVNSWLTGRRLVSLPFSDHCEPLVENAQDLRTLVSELEKGEARRWKYVEIRPHSGSISSLGGPGGFGAAAHYYLHTIDLRPSAEELFRSFHEDSVRRKIKRAEREHLEYVEGRSEALLEEFYRLFVLTRRRHQLPPQPMAWFRNLVACLGKKLVIRVARVNQRPIASIITLCHRKTITYKYGCSDARFHNLGGMALLLWRTIQEAKQNGMEEFDLGRTEPENAGLVKYKGHWSTQRRSISYWRFPAAHSQELYEGWPTRVAKRVFARIPESLFMLAGRLLYKHIG